MIRLKFLNQVTIASCLLLLGLAYKPELIPKVLLNSFSSVQSPKVALQCKTNLTLPEWVRVRELIKEKAAYSEFKQFTIGGCRNSAVVKGAKKKVEATFRGKKLKGVKGVQGAK